MVKWRKYVVFLLLICVFAFVVVWSAPVADAAYWQSGALVQFGDFKFDNFMLRSGGRTEQAGFPFAKYGVPFSGSFGWSDFGLGGAIYSTVNSDTSTSTVEFEIMYNNPEKQQFNDYQFTLTAENLFLPYGYSSPTLILGDSGPEYSVTVSFVYMRPNFDVPGKLTFTSERYSRTYQQSGNEIFPNIADELNLQQSTLNYGGFWLRDVIVTIDPEVGSDWDGFCSFYFYGGVSDFNSRTYFTAVTSVFNQYHSNKGIPSSGNIIFEDVDFTGWLANSAKSIFELEIADGVSLGGVLAAIIGLGLVAYFIKLFGK